MTRLPLVISVPHAGWLVPPELQTFCSLSLQEILDDADAGAGAVYLGLEPLVAELVTTRVARAIVDVNRAPDDRGDDGVVKTRTCWDVPIYESPPPEELLALLIGRHHRTYHEQLSAAAARDDTVLGIDCHTMAATGPPLGPDPGRKRPLVCLGDGEGTTCKPAWTRALADCLGRAFGTEVSVNRPFRGGYIVRAHAAELPWLQLELSRSQQFSEYEKADRVRQALDEFCRSVIGS